MFSCCGEGNCWLDDRSCERSSDGNGLVSVDVLPSCVDVIPSCRSLLIKCMAEAISCSRVFLVVSLFVVIFFFFLSGALLVIFSS